MASSTWASGTSRGSALMMPSTSVQIHSSAASRAAARIDAEKSEPPRPSVVGRPSAVAPLNPVTTGRVPWPQQGQQAGPRLFGGRLHQRRCVAEHGVGNHHFARIHGFRRRARDRQVFGKQRWPRAIRR